MPTSPRYVSTSQAAECLSLSREHVRRLIQRGELRAEETVNGFMVNADDVARLAAERQIRQVERDQRDFRSAVSDLVIKARHVEDADVFRSVVATLRDDMKGRSAFELPAAAAPQVEWIKQQVAAQEALVTLAVPAEAIAEQWRRYDEDVRLATESISVEQKERGENVISVMEVSKTQEQRKDDPLAIASLVTPRPPEVARGFVVAESREARLEEKVDVLSRKVEQLTEIVTQRRADTVATPTWQAWAGSDRPEDILAKLDTVREGVTGGKRMSENSTDIIRTSREARGGDA